MSNLCEPVLGSNDNCNRLMSYQSIPDFLERSLAAVVASFYMEVLEKGPMYHTDDG